MQYQLGWDHTDVGVSSSSGEENGEEKVANSSSGSVLAEKV